MSFQGKNTSKSQVLIQVNVTVGLLNLDMTLGPFLTERQWRRSLELMRGPLSSNDQQPEV